MELLVEAELLDNPKSQWNMDVPGNNESLHYWEGRIASHLM